MRLFGMWGTPARALLSPRGVLDACECRVRRMKGPASGPEAWERSEQPQAQSLPLMAIVAQRRGLGSPDDSAPAPEGLEHYGALTGPLAAFRCRPEGSVPEPCTESSARWCLRVKECGFRQVTRAGESGFRFHFPCPVLTQNPDILCHQIGD